jgi:hypothetical protein
VTKACVTCSSPTRRRLGAGYVCYGCAGIYQHAGTLAGERGEG